MRSTGSRHASFSSCGTWAQQLWLTGSRAHAGSAAVGHRPGCSAACGILPNQGSNLCPPALAGRFLTTAPPGKSKIFPAFTPPHLKMSYSIARSETAPLLSADHREQWRCWRSQWVAVPVGGAPLQPTWDFWECLASRGSPYPAQVLNPNAASEWGKTTTLTGLAQSRPCTVQKGRILVCWDHRSTAGLLIGSQAFQSPECFSRFPSLFPGLGGSKFWN